MIELLLIIIALPVILGLFGICISLLTLIIGAVVELPGVLLAIVVDILVLLCRKIGC